MATDDQKISLKGWLAEIKKSHEMAAAPPASPSGCCQVSNPQTGGFYLIPTDAATCQAIGGTFTPGPC